MKKRRGFALITVILVSAILVASGFIFARSVATERYIGQSNGYYKLALDMAEAGLARTIQDVRTENAGAVGGSYLTPTDFEALKTVSTTVDLTERVYTELGTSRQVGTFRVSAASTSNDVANKIMGIRLKSEGRVYPSNVPLTTFPTGVEPAGRRFIEVSILVNYGSTASWESNGLGLAAFSGGKMTVNSKAIIRDGDAYSNTAIEFSNKADIVGGLAQAVSGVTGGTPASGSPPTGADPNPIDLNITFPALDVRGFREKSYGFVTGSQPFDGNTPIPNVPAENYPNPRSVVLPLPGQDVYYAALEALMASYSPHDADTYGPAYYYLSDVGPAMTFLNTLEALVEANPGNPELAKILKYAVFYFFTDGKTLSWTQGDWMQGTFFIDGNASFTGHSSGGNPGKPAVYVTGDLKIDGTKGLRFDGLLVAGGNFVSTSNVTIHGAVWAGGTMTLSGLDDTPPSSEPSKILYDEDIGNVSWPHYSDVPGVSASVVAGSWKELPN